MPGRGPCPGPPKTGWEEAGAEKPWRNPRPGSSGGPPGSDGLKPGKEERCTRFGTGSYAVAFSSRVIIKSSSLSSFLPGGASSSALRPTAELWAGDAARSSAGPGAADAGPEQENGHGTVTCTPRAVAVQQYSLARPDADPMTLFPALPTDTRGSRLGICIAQAFRRPIAIQLIEQVVLI